jgi:hypothetical protein
VVDWQWCSPVEAMLQMLSKAFVLQKKTKQEAMHFWRQKVIWVILLDPYHCNRPSASWFEARWEQGLRVRGHRLQAATRRIWKTSWTPENADSEALFGSRLVMLCPATSKAAETLNRRQLTKAMLTIQLPGKKQEMDHQAVYRMSPMQKNEDMGRNFRPLADSLKQRLYTTLQTHLRECH